MTQDRRTFLRTTAAAVSAAAASGCATDGSDSAASSVTPRLTPALLRAIGSLVLPSELGADGQEAAVGAFQAWAEDYEAVPELNHGYGTSRIRYGPPDPVPAWGAQLEALELEALKRHGVGFAELDVGRGDAIIRRHVEDEGTGMPNPLRARHVAVALLSHWLSTPDATDRCYGVRISPRTGRGLEGSASEPAGLV